MTGSSSHPKRAGSLAVAAGLYAAVLIVAVLARDPAPLAPVTPSPDTPLPERLSPLPRDRVTPRTLSVFVLGRDARPGPLGADLVALPAPAWLVLVPEACREILGVARTGIEAHLTCRTQAGTAALRRTLPGAPGGRSDPWIVATGHALEGGVHRLADQPVR